MFIWQGQSKGIGMWRGYKDGDEVPEEEAKADKRSSKWIKDGVLVDAEELKKKAEVKKAVQEKVEENRKKAEKSKGGKK